VVRGRLDRLAIPRAEEEALPVRQGVGFEAKRGTAAKAADELKPDVLAWFHHAGYVHHGRGGDGVRQYGV